MKNPKDLKAGKRIPSIPVTPKEAICKQRAEFPEPVGRLVKRGQPADLKGRKETRKSKERRRKVETAVCTECAIRTL